MTGNAQRPPIRIGGVTLAGPVVLAPMAGYTDLPFRRICRRMGAGAVYTELVSVDGLVRGSVQTLHMLSGDPAERPAAAHLYGSDPAVFAEAAAIVERMDRFDWIDINAGCPVPKVVRRGAGAGLLKKPERLFEIVRAVRAAVKLPVTVKTRIGASKDLFNIDDVARGVADAGADALALHARFTVDRHSGPADWETIARIKAGAGRMLVIGNGGVTTPAQAVEFLGRHGVDAVMIGRAAIGNPWFFAQAAAILDGGAAPPPPAPSERRAMMLEHLGAQIEFARTLFQNRRKKVDPEEIASRQFRAHLVKYVSGLPGAAAMRRRLNDVRSPADVEAAMDLALRGGEPAGA
ncbi:MAG: tRNA dihydrouridine synthase DusB [Lentisphaerae bacterium]|nr:tRNA dihydrouridine synthase DusB [Lentisphaerota bacterium]